MIWLSTVSGQRTLTVMAFTPDVYLTLSDKWLENGFVAARCGQKRRHRSLVGRHGAKWLFYY